MRLPILSACLSLTILSGCNFLKADGVEDDRAASAPDPEEGADSMASRDPAPGEAVEEPVPDSAPRPVMQAQVVLDRLGFSVGVVDGRAGARFVRALEAFQESRGLAVTGEFDAETRQALSRWNAIPATRVVTIPVDWVRTTLAPLPEKPADQAKLAELHYESLAEKLAERFHTTPEVLAALNPGGRPAGAPAAAPAPAETVPTSAPAPAPAAVSFQPGQTIRVPNVGADRIDPARVDDRAWRATLRMLGVGTDQPEAARLVVDESEGWLRAYDADDRLVAAFTVSTGSQHDPLPIGDWRVKGKAYNPTFVFNPELFWDVDDSEDKQHLPSGPNSPVGVVWIDLDKEHYGIHGTPEPALVGQTQSHGCVRLTNWDAARLAQMVSGRTEVVFQK
ncbi:L,D-transpeptidase [Erythrobacter sp. NE805]|uniref:L,D-transpeptidase family protein n=1 Tax=Erythrobacter sp. NE805 TaxID=3389875 RepID=UPI00396B4883